MYTSIYKYIDSTVFIHFPLTVRKTSRKSFATPSQLLRTRVRTSRAVVVNQIFADAGPCAKDAPRCADSYNTEFDLNTMTNIIFVICSLQILYCILYTTYKI